MYVQPQTEPIDLIVVEVVDPEGHKLITKNILNL
jgi:spermidine synthase